MKKFKVKHYEIQSDKIKDTNPITIVMLCDLHNKSYGKDNIQLLEAIYSINPNIILVAGDLVIGEPKIPVTVADSLMKELSSRYPVYYGNGNHEQRMRNFTGNYTNKYKQYRDNILSHGVIYLENQKEDIIAHGNLLTIYGYEFPGKYYRKFSKSEFKSNEIEEVFTPPKTNRYNILLAHNPVYFPEYAKWGADLTLSGHLHGGIVRLPLLGGVISPQLKLFPKYDHGIFDIQGKKLIVGSGLGGHTINIRINNPPELVVIRLINTDINVTGTTVR